MPKSRGGHARAKSVPWKRTHASAFCAKRLNSGIKNRCFSTPRLSELAVGKLPTAIGTEQRGSVPTTSLSNTSTLYVNGFNQNVKWSTRSLLVSRVCSRAFFCSSSCPQTECCCPEPTQHAHTSPQRVHLLLTTWKHHFDPCKEFKKHLFKVNTLFIPFVLTGGVFKPIERHLGSVCTAAITLHSRALSARFDHHCTAADQLLYQLVVSPKS